MAELLEQLDINKCIYGIKEDDSKLFVFELVLKKYGNQKAKIIRKIIRSDKGNLISPDENIKYSEIKKIYLTAINMNDPTTEILLTVTLDHYIKLTHYSDAYIKLNIISSIGGFMECTFNIY